MYFFILLLFILGLVIGSFLNVVILRRIKGERLSGRSICESCGKTLSWKELIPLVSFAMQKGRCRACAGGLSRQYPLVEGLTGLLYAAAGYYFYKNFVFDWRSFLFGVIILAGIASAIDIFVSDLKFKIIPNRPVAVISVLGVLAVYLRSGGSDFGRVLNDLAAALAISFLFFGIWFISQGKWMGLGDAKLIFATSLVVGFPASIAAVLLAFWSGGLAGIILLLAKLKTPRSQIPFGPFILLGAAFSLFLTPFLTNFIILI